MEMGAMRSEACGVRRDAGEGYLSLLLKMMVSNSFFTNLLMSSSLIGTARRGLARAGG